MKFIDEIVKAQRARIDKFGKDSPKVADILLIFDDLLGSIKPNSLEQQQLNWLFSTSRHINIGLLVISQTSRILISPTIRANSDYIFWRQVNENYIRSIFESIFWSSGNFNSFLKFTKCICRYRL